MTRSEAVRAIEALRMGIPPEGSVRQFTVGRDSEIGQLTQRLDKGDLGALLLRANYGSGKSHLLRFIRECALNRGYVVSSVTLDARHAVRLNRMDQIVGTIWRGMEVPDALGITGVPAFLDGVCQRFEVPEGEHVDQSWWNEVSNGGRWDLSDTLDSSAMFVAVRAWVSRDLSVRERIEDWLLHPWQYYTQRKKLYVDLVEDLQPHFRDARREWQFYADDVFVLNSQDYYQSWAMLRDMERLANAAGMRGLIVLFDEVEDVLDNIGNIAHQEKAFSNLFHFFSGRRFGGMTFHAVTPGFSEKCKDLLMGKERWDYDYSRFDALPAFELSPLDARQLGDLALRVMDAHALAYSWEPDLEVKTSELRRLVKQATQIRVQDRARYAIKAVVEFLDDRLEETS